LCLPVQSDGPSARSLTEQKNCNLRILPADGTIAARVAPLGIRHFPLAARKQITSFQQQPKDRETSLNCGVDRAGYPRRKLPSQSV
jgi:hypothetical protein